MHFDRKLFMITGMRPFIADELCKGCGECVETCPYEVFKEEDEGVVVAAPEDCIE